MAKTAEATGLARKNKYKKKALEREDMSLNINLDGSLLEMYANYAISENGNIHFSMINNLFRLLLMVSDAPISMNERSMALKNFTISALRAKIEKHITNKQALLSIGLGECGIRPDLLNADSFKELGDGEVEWVEDTILNYTNLTTVNNSVRQMQDVCQDYITSDPTERIARAKEVQAMMDNADKIAPITSKLVIGSGQAVQKEAEVTEALPQVTADKDTAVMRTVEQIPEFPGGIVQFMKWLTRNLRYPPQAQQQKIQGKVVISFIVNKDGSISAPTIVKSVDPVLDSDAMRVVRMMPRWKPGMEKGKPCRTMFAIPINFVL